eukprot:CAMPEP_0114566150 /NCGR_PEP_ID=MMETSP0114-20121206/14727_1 /TAXON_ID=31324 /ORGANISM="Goniomonas sp, Strain m" /LENGTH=674 /DNA_ID=CAMNT_0001752519 /DNA_START=13 /DNA_END=2034 /DNA_ORIENTATION=-
MSVFWALVRDAAAQPSPEKLVIPCTTDNYQVTHDANGLPWVSSTPVQTPMGSHIPAPIPENEQARLRTLRSYELLDTDRNDKVLDSLVNTVARSLSTEFCLVSLVDEKRQFFKAAVGLEAAETPRDIAFCAWAILPSAEPEPEIFIVEDATKDRRFAGNPLVQGAPHIRFYAGVPLVAPNGHRLGTLCAIDSKTRKMEPAEQEMLSSMASLVMRELESRRKRPLLDDNVVPRSLRLRKTLQQVSHHIRTPLHTISGSLELMERPSDPDQAQLLDDLTGGVAALLENVTGLLETIKSPRSTPVTSPSCRPSLLMPNVADRSPGTPNKPQTPEPPSTPSKPPTPRPQTPGRPPTPSKPFPIPSALFSTSNGNSRESTLATGSFSLPDPHHNSSGSFSLSDSRQNSSGKKAQSVCPLCGSSSSLKLSIPEPSPEMRVPCTPLLTPGGAGNSSTTPAPESGIGSLRTLIVDDQLMNLKILNRMLTRLGVQNIDQRVNGQECVDAVKEKDYDIVFLDLQMPVMGGTQAAALISQLPRVPYLVAITADATSGAQTRCESAGFHWFLLKPTTLDLVREAMWLGTRHEAGKMGRRWSNAEAESDVRGHSPPLPLALTPAYPSSHYTLRRSWRVKRKGARVTYVDTDQGAVGYGGEEFRMSPFGLGVFLERDPTVSTSTSFGG